MNTDALVIGGGPGGATAALLLARADWRVTLIEKSEFPRRKVCGEFISATSLALLREIGIEQRFLDAAGPPVRRVGVFAGDAMLTASMPQARVEGQWGHALGREHLDTMLVEAAARAGATILQPCKAIELQRRQDGFICTTSDGEIAARVAIAANGSWERAPYPTETPPHRPSDLLAFKAHFRHGDLSPDLMPLLAFPGGYGGLVTSDDGRISLSCCIRRDALQSHRRDGEHAADTVIRHIMASCLGVRRALQHAELEDSWLSAGPIRPGIRARYADGIFRVGNAAGEAHPVVAEGISMALQSAWLLCRHLIAGHSLDDVARRYDAEWKSAFAPRIHAAALFAQIAMRPSAVAALLPLFRLCPQLITFGARLAGKSTEVVTA